jgi:Protein of unknown function (DUF1360)
MSTMFVFALCVFATWRVAHFFAAEDGPFDIVVRLRRLAGDSQLGHLMDCFYCLSIWPAAAFAPLIAGNAIEFVLVWLAISGAACLLEQATAPRASNNAPVEQHSERNIP